MPFTLAWRPVPFSSVVLSVVISVLLACIWESSFKGKDCAGGGNSSALTWSRLEELVAHGPADDELFVRIASPRRHVDDPVRAPHEAQVFPEVLSEGGEAGERDAVPEAAATSALEESLP